MIVATENDHLNGLAMLFGKLVTGRAQGFADVRTYWSPEAVRKATGYRARGRREGVEGLHPPRSIPARPASTRDGEVKDENGNGVMKRLGDARRGLPGVPEGDDVE